MAVVDEDVVGRRALLDVPPRELDAGFRRARQRDLVARDDEAEHHLLPDRIEQPRRDVPSPEFRVNPDLVDPDDGPATCRGTAVVGLEQKRLADRFRAGQPYDPLLAANVKVRRKVVFWLAAAAVVASLLLGGSGGRMQ